MVIVMTFKFNYSEVVKLSKTLSFLKPFPVIDAVTVYYFLLVILLLINSISPFVFCWLYKLIYFNCSIWPTYGFLFQILIHLNFFYFVERLITCECDKGNIVFRNFPLPTFILRQ